MHGYEVADACRWIQTEKIEWKQQPQVETVAVVGLQHLKVKRIIHDQQVGRPGTFGDGSQDFGDA